MLDWSLFIIGEKSVDKFYESYICPLLFYFDLILELALGVDIFLPFDNEEFFEFVSFISNKYYLNLLLDRGVKSTYLVFNLS